MCSRFLPKFVHLPLGPAHRSPIMSVLEKVIANNKAAEELLTSLRVDFNTIKNGLIAKRKNELIKENGRLLKEIEAAKSQLVQLETKNGKKQIPIPGQNETPVIYSMSSEIQSSDTAKPQDKPDATEAVASKPPKEKKPKKEKPSSAENEKKSSSSVPVEAPIDVGRLDFKVGKIIEVSKHPDADSLYLEKIDCGEPNPRTVVSGLVKFVPIEEMRDRMVVVLCNLKPAKMRGITSEAMVMCASTPEKVEVLSPPQGAVPGDLVHCEGFDRKPDAQLNPKKKIFETCAPDLKTNDELFACFKGSPLYVPEKGKVSSQTLKNVPVK